MISAVLPQTDNLSDIELAYVTYERVALSEFMTMSRGLILENLGQTGLTDIYNRDDHNKLRKRFSNPADPLFLLGSYLDIFDSPLRQLLPFNQRIRDNSLLVRQNRNLWAHFQPPEMRNEILIAIRQLKQFCDDMNLPGAAETGGAIFTKLSQISIERNRLMNGQSVPTPSGATIQKPTDPSDEVEAVIGLPARPRIGGLWEHELPSTVFELNKRYGDILDGNGDSQSARLPKEFKGTLARWFNLDINSWLYVDERDKATVALIGGDPYLIGFLGKEPDLAKGEFRGFFLPGTFVNAGGKLVDLDNPDSEFSSRYEMSSLTPEWIESNVPEDATVRLTDHGDVVLIDETGVSCILQSVNGAVPKGM
jgi:hypothetical protein